MTWNSSIEAYLRDLAFKNYYTYDEYKPYASGEKMEYLKPEQYFQVLSNIIYQLPNTNKHTINSFTLKKIRPIYKIATERGFCSTVNPNAGIYYTPE